MAGIIITAALGLIEMKEIRFLVRIKAWKDLFIVLGTAAITISFGLELGLLISILFSLFSIIKHTTTPTVTIRGRVPNTRSFQDLTVFRDLNLFKKKHDWFGESGILIIRIEESLYFANIHAVKSLFWKIEQMSEYPLKGVIIDVKNVARFDTTAAQVLLEMLEDFAERDITVCFVKLREHNQQLFWRSGLMDMIGVHRMFSKTIDALNHMSANRAKEYSSYQIRIHDA